MEKTAIILLILASLSFSAACVDDFVDIWTGDLGVNIGVALMLSIIIIGIAYMAGSSLNDANLVVFAKDELWHVLFTFVLLIGFAGLLGFSCQAFSYFLDFSLGSDLLDVQGPGKCYTGVEGPQTVAECYLTSLKKSTERLVRDTYKENLKLEMDATYVVSVFNPFTGGASVPTTAYKRAYAMQFDMIVGTFILPALVSISMQKVAVQFATDLTNWILPAAIFLRILPPTRQMGNILIAFAIAFYIVVPVFYALNAAMDEVAFSDCERYLGMIYDPVMGGCESGFSYWQVARILPQAYFLPNLTLALIVTFVSAINKALKVIG
jgi:hypothetical protein